MHRDNKEARYVKKLARNYFSNLAVEDGHRREREMVCQEVDYILGLGENPKEKRREEMARERGFSVGKGGIKNA